MLAQPRLPHVPTCICHHDGISMSFCLFPLQFSSPSNFSSFFLTFTSPPLNLEHLFHYAFLFHCSNACYSNGSVFQYIILLFLHSSFVNCCNGFPYHGCTIYNIRGFFNLDDFQHDGGREISTAYALNFKQGIMTCISCWTHWSSITSNKWHAILGSWELI